MNEDLLPVPELKNPEDDYAFGKYRIAMVIGDMIHQVLVLEASEAAKYLSEPIFVQIPKTLYISPGDKYIDGKFVHRK